MQPATRNALHRWFASLLLAMLAVPGGAPQAASTDSCKLAKLADLQLNLDGRRTRIAAKINGADAQFMLDSGAFWSTLTLAAAKQYNLPVDYNVIEGLRIEGAGGSIPAGVTHVKNFTVFELPIKNMDFIVVGAQVDGDAAGLIGQNLLRYADVEYDLGHGQLRLFLPKNCRDSLLAYWVHPDDTLSVVKMESTDVSSPHTITTAYLNGERIRVMLDTGASVSIVTLRAARRAGMTPDSAGVIPGGTDYGLGRRTFDTWIGRFNNFKIGEEEIQNARLRFADFDLPVDMLLGADFFLSHRILVSNSQHKLYISYGGGPVFDLRRRPSAAEGGGAPAPAAAPPAAAAAATAASDDQHRDAAGYAQRAAIDAARNMPERALADLDRACELAPDNTDYRLARARLRWRARQPGLALEDYERVLKAQPANVEALLARAALEINRRDFTAAGADLDRLDLLVPRAAEQRIELAQLNFAARRPELSIPQLNEWIELHPEDAALPVALNDRCWARALLGRELDAALGDCNRALRGRPDTASFLDSRALVQLRRGKWDRSIEDYDAALLAKRPKQAWSLYGRGVARMRKGMKAEAQADIDAAIALDAHIAEDAAHFGIAP